MHRKGLNGYWRFCSAATTTARFSRLRCVPGWSDPRAASRIARARSCRVRARWRSPWSRRIACPSCRSSSPGPAPRGRDERHRAAVTHGTGPTGRLAYRRERGPNAGPGAVTGHRRAPPDRGGTVMPIHRGTCRSGQAPPAELLCSIAPPDVLARVAERGSPEEREAAIRTLVESVALRARRNAVSSLMRDLNADLADFSFMSGTPAVAAGKRRTVYDAKHGGHRDLPGRRERGEGDPPAADPAVNEAYEGSGATYDFYLDVFKRNSIDGEGLELVSSVHYLTDYDNAGWNGVQMV